jgi:hypothetical protein
MFSRGEASITSTALLVCIIVLYIMGSASIGKSIFIISQTSHGVLSLIPEACTDPKCITAMETHSNPMIQDLQMVCSAHAARIVIANSRVQRADTHPLTPLPRTPKLLSKEICFQHVNDVERIIKVPIDICIKPANSTFHLPPRISRRYLW